MQEHGTVRTSTFLKDVLICSLGAYGGPEAHISVFLDQLVHNKKYLNEEELIELVALCSILPGPTSTQTIVAIGYRKGGPLLALLTMLVWGLPVITVMGALSFLYGFLAGRNLSHEFLRFVGPMAVGFIVVAAIRIGRKVVSDMLTAFLMIAGGVATYFIRTPWIFPVVLVLGGLASILSSREPEKFTPVTVRPKWFYLALFTLFAIGSLALAGTTGSLLARLFEAFYRYGYLVFGGGQVVVPVMHTDLVEVWRSMSSTEFITGYGLVQGLPGPMFSFAAYAGGMAARGHGVLVQILGATVGGIGIFLPGILLIYFFLPLWEEFKRVKAVRISLRGINAAAAGMISSAAVLLLQESGLSPINLAAAAIAAVWLYVTRWPAPLLVALALLAGFVI